MKPKTDMKPDALCWRRRVTLSRTLLLLRAAVGAILTRQMFGPRVLGVTEELQFAYLPRHSSFNPAVLRPVTLASSSCEEPPKAVIVSEALRPKARFEHRHTHHSLRSKATLSPSLPVFLTVPCTTVELFRCRRCLVRPLPCGPGEDAEAKAH